MDVVRSRSTSRRSLKWGLFGVIVVGVITAVSAGLTRLQPALPTFDRSVAIFDTVKRGTMLRDVKGAGTLVPVNIKWVTSEVGGQIVEVLVEPGAEVTPETKLVKLHDQQLEDILHLALLNSREYQAQKEQLYRVALGLSLEQYDYQLKFAPFGNRTGARYEDIRSNTGSQTDLQIPSRVQLEALATTGSSLVTRFANDVLLTFNGPDGFAADISSELFFGVAHSVFQNDVRFERLTQAERNVVYAARNFARFRCTFYLQLAAQYYNLLRNYRQIEIDAQNYLSLVRVYGQREIEFAAGEVARVQMDQVEQNTLDARSKLIANCNVVENTVDRFKLQMGLPTETAIHLDLAELRSLTQNDEQLVKLQLVKRVESRLVT